MNSYWPWGIGPAVVKANLSFKKLHFDTVMGKMKYLYSVHKLYFDIGSDLKIKGGNIMIYRNLAGFFIMVIVIAHP